MKDGVCGGVEWGCAAVVTLGSRRKGEKEGKRNEEIQEEIVRKKRPASCQGPSV
jgi:hypothetical protein